MSDPRSEPSMEDILASIKRIIADDKQLPLDRAPALRSPAAARPEQATRPEPARPSEPPRPLSRPERALPGVDRPSAWPGRSEPPQPPESILELTDRAPEAMQPPRVPLASRAPEAEPSPPSSWPPPAPPPAPPAAETQLPVQRAADRARYADASWQVAQEDGPSSSPAAAPQSRPPAPRDLGRTVVNRASAGDNTLEGLVREMLRPMLSDWVEAHLPAMVERLVQAEIKRMMEREGGK